MIYLLHISRLSITASIRFTNDSNTSNRRTKRYVNFYFFGEGFCMSNLARNTDPVTSHIAAHRIVKSGKQKSGMANILNCIQSYPNSTGGEIARKLGIDYTECQRRISDLVNAHKVVRGAARVCDVKQSKCSTVRLA